MDFVPGADAREDTVDQADPRRAAGTNEPICAMRQISATCRR